MSTKKAYLLELCGANMVAVEVTIQEHSIYKYIKDNSLREMGGSKMNQSIHKTRLDGQDSSRNLQRNITTNYCNV